MMPPSPYIFTSSQGAETLPVSDTSPSVNPIVTDENGNPIPGAEPPAPDTGAPGGSRSLSDILGGILAPTSGTTGGSGTVGGRARVGRRSTLRDDLNEASTRFAGQSWDSMTTAQRNGFQRFFGIVDRQAIQQFGKPYRNTSSEQRAELSDQLTAMGIQPEVLPEDQPGAVTRESRMESLMVKQPTPPRAPSQQRPSLPSWSTVAAVMGPDAQQLASAWQGGSLGTTAVSGTRLRRYMAMFPIAPTPYAFISALRSIWGQSGTRATQQKVSTPKISTSSPRPVRYSRNVVSSLQPPLPTGGQ